MRFTDYVGSTLTMWKSIGQQMAAWVKVTTWCNECGATHEVEGDFPGGECREVGTMFHKPWCSVDMRNIRRNFTVVRR